MENSIYLEKDFGWFLGSFDNNWQHQHYAIQLSIPLNSNICLELPDNTITTKSPGLIKSNIAHRITTTADHFLLLLNPASIIGLFDSPDAFYKMHGQQLNPIKKWIFRNFVRHLMNRNVDRIRKIYFYENQAKPAHT